MKNVWKAALIVSATFCFGSGAFAQSAFKDWTPYIGGSINLSEVTATPGGFNTNGNFSNVHGNDKRNAVGGSLVLGAENLFQFGNGASLRGEFEFNRFVTTGCSLGVCTPSPTYGVNSVDFVTNSFPGPPFPATFFYRVDSQSHSGFANIYLDFDLPVVEAPVEAFLGGGIGVSHHNIALTDTVVYGSSSSYKFSWQIGGGLKYALSDNVDLIGGVRYMNLGTSNTALFTIAGNFPVGNYTLRQEVVEARIGLNIKLGALLDN